MAPLLLIAAAAQDGPVQSIARSFGVDWAHLIAQIISFAIVCALLYRFAYHPVLAMLAQRRRLIEEGLANAEKVKKELADTELKRQEVLKQAAAQAAKLIEEAHAAADQVRQRETQKAIADAESIITKAHQATVLDHDQMLADLKREVGHLVVTCTEAVTGKVLTPEDQQRLAEETTREVVAA
jgi:F-type H+-transporting ATPase subunit b